MNPAVASLAAAVFRLRLTSWRRAFGETSGLSDQRVVALGVVPVDSVYLNYLDASSRANLRRERSPAAG